MPCPLGWSEDSGHSAGALAACSQTSKAIWSCYNETSKLSSPR